MKNAPIVATLDLWALGHSAGQIADMLGYPNRKHVERIIEKARSINDKRAVLHVAANGRLIGRPGRMKLPPVAIPVPALPRKTHCPKGHLRTPDNVDAQWHCRICKNRRRA